MNRTHEVLIVAVPETAGSALYGMTDVLMAAGTLWDQLVEGEDGEPLFSVRIVSPDGRPFDCGNGIPVRPDVALKDNPRAEIVILPELWLRPDEVLHGRYSELMDWIRRSYEYGSALYSACSGAVVLAESGLLDGCAATSHWAYQDLFRLQYPRVRFRPEPNLVFADETGRIVTAGGTSSWHDLALHLIARYGSPGEACRIAKVYLLKWHDEGQLPYAALARHGGHSDAVVRDCEQWLADHYLEDRALRRVVERAGLPERTLKRRFRAATGTTLIDYIQNLRIEKAKRLLESPGIPVDEISAEAGYEDPSFFRRLFRRRTGLTPHQYRRLFQPLRQAGDPAAAEPA